MIENLQQLEDAIDELNITKSCKLRVSIDGEEILRIIGLTYIDDENGGLCDIHLERKPEQKKLN
tara:strand:+ start:180 stop:371 length:192 start_codon:yes stop_codon:yes gene_type:complete